MSNEPKGDLTEQFRRLIRANGPISLAQYMGESNARYYTSRDPLGAEADFITAPEVSQVFGEMIGLWLAEAWERSGRPEPLHYVELGPGRGTLAVDALRAMAKHGLHPQVHFVEGSEALRKSQKQALPEVTHHADAGSLPHDAPLLIVANEFFDALPIRQLVRTENGWRERMVGLQQGELAFVAGDKPMDMVVPEHLCDAEEGTLIETSPASAAVMSELADRLVTQGGAALVIDYGAAQPEPGSTLQAIRAHQKVGVFAHPGEMDLTAHVDFGALHDTAMRQGARVLGVTAQGEWLSALGADLRFEALKRHHPDKAEVLDRQRARLMAPEQMGELFKVMGIVGKDWPKL